MNKICISGAALALAISAGSAIAAAAQAGSAAPPPPPPPMWTSFYVGLNAGGTFGDSATSLSHIPVFSSPTNGFAKPALAAAALAGSAVVGRDNAGFIGGGQIGYNWQFLNSFVAGVEADIQGVAGGGGSSGVVLAARVNIPLPLGRSIVGAGSVAKSLDYIGTARGRVGYLVTPSLLVYGTGGLAYGGVRSSASLFQSFTPIPPASWTGAWGSSGSHSDTRVGWAAGGGAEWMFWPDWSAKVEYLYYDLGTVNYSAGVSGSFLTLSGQPIFLNQTNVSTRFNGHVARAGVNYHFNFGAAPVVAKY